MLHCWDGIRFPILCGSLMDNMAIEKQVMEILGQLKEASLLHYSTNATKNQGLYWIPLKVVVASLVSLGCVVLQLRYIQVNGAELQCWAVCGNHGPVSKTVPNAFLGYSCFIRLKIQQPFL